jgi:UDP-2,4-diacetamido-2,4,6-trideoxy-beta-L-altropyranose hydrolase
MMGRADRLCVIRADASLTLGGGHIYRTLVLAEALRDTGWTCAFACLPETLTIVPALASRGHEICLLETREDEEPAVLRHRFPNGCALLVVDHYRRDLAFERSLRGWAAKILAVEDLQGRAHDCDIFLDQTHAWDARHMAQAAGRLALIGHEYALLRPGFANRRLRQGLRIRRSPPNNILVQAGASDPFRLAQPLTKLAQIAFPQSRIMAVLGSSSPSLSAMRSMAEASGGQISLNVDAAHMDALMDEADLMLGAAGSSCWEACCLGLPMALVQIAENQAPVIGFLTAIDVSLSLGYAEDVLTQPLESLALTLQEGVARLDLMSQRAACITDGLGPRRLMLALEPQMSRKGAAIRLRAARRADGQLLLDWQCDPSTRRYFRNSAPPSPEQHFLWLESRLQGDKGPFSLILADEVPVGVVRLDRRDDKRRNSTIPAFEVSLSVESGRRGEGIGTAALAAARRLTPEADLVAHIVPENASSLSTFAKAGFLPEGEDWKRLKADKHD